ncbi:hypothetical protein CAEBREN_28460 [Caenorhabditis brenneri]|uniref:Uncharacterized protein n=1 Tax=Caenorhabditis brenneri TaxID=135651 RepID=G0NH96_CAEBE|nr:hypothetical protein CAEBREN_28460 [Caenorhabditis brenneri]
MGKSKSKSHSRSISKWRKFFGSADKTAESREDNTTQTTMMSLEPQANPSPPVKNMYSGGNSRSKSITKRRPIGIGTREDTVAPRTALEEKSADGPVPLSPHLRDEKKKGSGSKCEEDQKSKNAKKKESKKEEEADASIFEEVVGPSTPAQTGTHGIKNKMRWKIDVEGADVNGDQKMSDVMEKLTQLRKKSRMKKCKVLKANEKAGGGNDEDDELPMESLITKELSESDQEILRGFCRSGDQEEKAEALIEKITVAVLNAVVTKNEFIRQVSISGQLRMFAVDEKKSKNPMMALLLARKDLLYVSWSKPNRDVENTLDGTWAGMTVKKVPQAAVQSTLL